MRRRRVIRRPRKQRKKKGISEFMLVPLFLLIGIITLMVFTYFYWNKLGYSQKLLTTMAADRTARAVNLVGSYQQNGSLEMKFSSEYQFKIRDDYLVVSRRGKSGTAYFFVKEAEVKGGKFKTNRLQLSKEVTPQGNIILTFNDLQEG